MIKNIRHNHHLTILVGIIFMHTSKNYQESVTQPSQFQFPLSPHPQIHSFFEFNDRLEAILTKAYIYRSASHGICVSFCRGMLVMET